MSNDFIISQEDWSLHRKGYEDQKRHQEKIKEVMKSKMPDLITEQEIITGNHNGTVRIPIKELNEYKIIYKYEKTQQVGMGNGKSEIGDTVARGKDEESQGEKGNFGPGEGAAGGGYYEAEIDLAEIEKEIFSNMELPNLEKKEAGVMTSDSYEFNDIGRVGITGNIHKKKTLMAAFKRNALNGKSSFYPVKPEDLRYRTWNDIKKPDTRAVIIAMMDTSGSMGIWEKYMARSFFHWTKRFLETKYESVEIVYISHSTNAWITNEHNFFHKGDEGGTICSSAERLALKLINEKYSPSQYNIYAFHASDGDNLTSDNARAVKLIEEIMKKANLFAYIEVNQYNRHSTFFSALKYIRNEKFRHYIMREKADVYNALKSIFRKEDLYGEENKETYKSS